MSDEPTGGADEGAAGQVAAPAADAPTAVDGGAEVAEGDVVAEQDDEAGAGAIDDASPAAEIVDLAWDDDLPVALGEETELRDDASGGEGRDERVGEDDQDGGYDGVDDLGELVEEDRVAGRRNALPRRVESWRSRSASGAIVTAIAMGLQQVFEPERRRPAAVAEAPSDPYSDDDPITVDYVPDDAEATTVHVKPWLLQKGDPS